MTLSDYAIAGVPDLTVDQLTRILRDAQSPATPEAIHIHAALKATGVRPSVWLGFFFVESKMGTVGVVKDFDTKNAGNVRSPEVAALGSVIQTPRGPFARYLTWADGAYDWGKRLTGPKYGQAGLKTVKQVLPKYAPSDDQNDPDAYARTVLQKVEEWTKGAPPVALQKPPVDTDHPSPNRGYASGTHRVDAVIWHITQGSNSLGWLTNPASGASSNYLIARTGKTYELVPPTESAWANGRVCKPDADHNQPLIKKWLAEGVNFNRRVVSIEHEGMSSLGKGGSLTKAQIEATVKLTAWLCQEFNLTPDGAHIFGHFEIDACDRPNCPGFSPAEWTDWVGRVAGLLAGAPPSAMIEPVVTERTDWAGKGRLISEEVTVCNDDTGQYYSRKKEWAAEGVKVGEWREV